MKSKVIAAATAFLGGTFGLHKVYIGSKNCVRIALLSTVFSWTGVPTLAGIIQSVRYLAMSDLEFNEYVLQQKLGADVLIIDTNSVQRNTLQHNELQRASTTAQSEFTDAVYNKLFWFSHEITTIISQLKHDAGLLRELKNNPQQINNCVVYDMVQIFSMLFGNSYENKRLEAFCCFLLLPTANSDLIKTKGLNALQVGYNVSKYDGIISGTLLSYMNMDNPLLMEILDSISANATITLSLPIILKKVNQTLFHNYAGMLCKYMEILVTTDDIADINEQHNMHQINKIIYES